MGCPNGTSSSSPCSQARGGLFQPAQSKSWRPFGNYTVDLEVNLGYDYSAPLGLDTVALGFSDSIGGPTIRSQVVSALAPYDFYLGVFGLGQQSTNVSNFTNPYPSFLTAMKNENLIPSLSWAYTAGAPYRKFISSVAILKHRALLLYSWVVCLHCLSKSPYRHSARSQDSHLIRFQTVRITR